MESKFKVGDRVLGYKFRETETVFHHDDMKIFIGEKGLIKEIDYDDHTALVSFGHEEKNCWWYPLAGLRKLNINKHKSNIHTDIQSLKDKYPQFNITVSVEEKV